MGYGSFYSEAQLLEGARVELYRLRATIAKLTAERDAARGAVEVLRRLWKQFEGVSVDIPEDSWEMVLDLHSSGKATAGQIRTALSHSPPAVSMEEVAEVLEGIVDHSIMPGTGDSSDDARVTAIWVLRTRAILTRIRARGGKEVQGAE